MALRIKVTFSLSAMLTILQVLTNQFLRGLPSRPSSFIRTTKLSESHHSGVNDIVRI